MLHRSLVIFSVTLILLHAPAWGGDSKALKILATAKDSSYDHKVGAINFRQGDMHVIRSAEQLVAASIKSVLAKDPAVQKEMEKALAKVLKVDSIDWTKQMVLVGIAHSVDSVKTDSKVLSVTYTRYAERPTRAPQLMPWVVVLAERFEGKVTFVPKEKEKKTDPKK